jgi:hypothetical protein
LLHPQGGIMPSRTFVDKGYRGHDYDQPLGVFRSGQKRGLTPRIKRSLRRRSAIEPVIGHSVVFPGSHGKAATTITSTSIPGRQKSVVRQARTGGFAGSTHSFQTEL